MRLIDRQQRYAHLVQSQSKRLRCKAFRREIEELDVAIDAVVERDVDLSGRESRMDRHSRDRAAAQAVDLILHQRDQWRHDDAQTLLHQRWELVDD